VTRDESDWTASTEEMLSLSVAWNSAESATTMLLVELRRMRAPKNVLRTAENAQQAIRSVRTQLTEIQSADVEKEDP
jgi:hypothetical protein